MSGGAAPGPELEPSADTADSGRVADLCRLLPILGAFLLISPMVRVFAAPVSIGGVPLIIWFIFGVWAALIAAAAAFARKLRPAPPSDGDDGDAAAKAEAERLARAGGAERIS